jgi:Flp pilus assembly protein TadG
MPLVSYTIWRRPILHLRRLGEDQRAASIIEFALLLPLMLTLYISGTEISQAIGASRKVTIIAHTVADLVAQSSTKALAISDVSNALSAAGAIITPYSSGNLSVVVSQVCFDQSGQAKIGWSQATPANKAPAVGTPVTLDPALIPSSPPDSCTNPSVANAVCYILGQTIYAYTPQLGYAITGTLNMSDQMILTPRIQSCFNTPS